MDQCRSDVQGLIEEFLSGTSNPQSRTVTPLDELPAAMEEDPRAVLPHSIAGTELDLPVDGFGPLEGDGVAAYWPSEVPPGDGFPPLTPTGDISGWGLDAALWRGEFDRENVL